MKDFGQFLCLTGFIAPIWDYVINSHTYTGGLIVSGLCSIIGAILWYLGREKIIFLDNPNGTIIS